MLVVMLVKTFYAQKLKFWYENSEVSYQVCRMCDRYGEYWLNLEKEAIGQLKARLARAQKFGRRRCGRRRRGASRPHAIAIPAPIVLSKWIVKRVY